MAGTALRPLARMAWRNVRRNWRHSLAAMLAVVVGFVAICLFEGYIGELRRTQADGFAQRVMYGDLLVEKRGASRGEAGEAPFESALGEREQAFLEGFLRERADEVEARVRLLYASGMAGAGRSSAIFLAMGFDVAEGAVLRRDWAWNALAGKPLQDVGPAGAVIGRGLGAALDCVPEPGHTVMGADGHPIPVERPFTCRRPRLQLTATTETGQLNVVEPTVGGIIDGVMKELDDRLVMMPLPMAQQLLDTRVVSVYSIALRDRGDRDAFAAELAEAARARGIELDVMRWEDHPTAELLRRGLELLGVYRSFIVLVVVVIAGMSVLTTMMKSVSERTREIGTLRSLGFLRRHVVSLFAMEAGLLALLSAAAGLVVTLALTLALNSTGLSYRAGVLAAPIPLSVGIVPGAYLFAALFLGGVAAAAAVLPARRAARMSIPAALGHV